MIFAEEIADRAGRKRAERALEDAVAAGERGDAAGCVAGLKRAIEFHPRCLGARLLLAKVLGGSVQVQVGIARDVLREEEEFLGTDVIAANRGRLWRLECARPYFRVRARLADLLADSGRAEEATREYEAVLECDPGDHLGIRICLLACHLAGHRLGEAQWLLRSFDDNGTCEYSWALVLERHMAGDLPGAATRLAQARQRNAHVMRFLTGEASIPEDAPAKIDRGSEAEASFCAETLGDAWRRHPRAVEWLLHAT